MSKNVDQIAKEALALPSEARALLAERLVESLDPAEDATLRQLWSTEARRRRDEVRSGKVKTIPGDEALASVRSSFKK
jgi:putative addiction module component (TIGR02574 family)